MRTVTAIVFYLNTAFCIFGLFAAYQSIANGIQGRFDYLGIALAVLFGGLCGASALVIRHLRRQQVG